MRSLSLLALPALVLVALAPGAPGQIALPKPSGYGGTAGAADSVPAGGTYRGPGDGVRGDGPSGPASSPGPGSGDPNAPGGGGPRGPAARPSGGGAAAGSPVSPTTHEVGPEEWWTWWQLHKVEFLRPNLISHWVATVTRFGGGDEHPGAPLDRVRKELAAPLVEALGAPNPLLRASAGLAYGRVAGDAAVERLTRALRDPSIDVRERALFALGATGSPRAAEVLLRVARTGSPDEDGTATVLHDARALAVFALAVGRRNGLPESVDAGVAALADDARRPGESLLASSLLMYQTLAPNPLLADWALELARDEDAPLAVRCRALETLRSRKDERALFTLFEALESSHADLRRSAALALGEIDHPLATPRLVAACAEEREPLARGFLLVSIGRRGGDEGRDFLVAFLAEGPKPLRPWAALGLAMLARDGTDEAARTALREALVEARSADLRSALHLALGIARDRGSKEALEEAAAEASDPESRAAAAFGLAMLGGEGVAGLLEERLAAESNPIVRAEIAQALGYLGHAGSVDDLLAALRASTDPWLRISAAYALGLHGTRAALEDLIALGADATATPPVRGAAYEAAQLVLGRAPSLTIGELLRQANFAVFPPTLLRMRAIPL